jgi:hypothetical protein
MKNLITALKKAQLKFKALEKTAKNPFFKSKYATLDSCISASRDALSSEGLVIVQPTKLDGTTLLLNTILMHESGEMIESMYPVVPTKDDPQGLGSALTYARRYCYCSIIGLVAEEDDDGNEGSKPKKQEPPKAVTPEPPQTPDVTIEYKDEFYKTALMDCKNIDELNQVRKAITADKALIKDAKSMREMIADRKTDIETIERMTSEAAE